jgi:hypothetical protein
MNETIIAEIISAICRGVEQQKGRAICAAPNNQA